VVHTLYEQQHQMFKAGETRIADRIVSIHEPHVRPIMRGKARCIYQIKREPHFN
jgi:IS5 family transposase